MDGSEDLLTDLKKGDSVFIYHYDYRGERFEVDKVKRVSSTLILLEKSEIRFRRKTGSQIQTDTWVHGSKLYPFTEKNMEEYSAYRKRNKFIWLVHQLSEWATDRNLGSLTRDQLDDVISKISVVNDELIKNG